jgi:hypothetical protein
MHFRAHKFETSNKDKEQASERKSDQYRTIQNSGLATCDSSQTKLEPTDHSIANPWTLVKLT